MSHLEDISALRKHYTKGGLIEGQFSENPFTLFAEWFREAIAMEILEPNAMVLSTVSVDGKPSSRAVLLKGVEEEGFVFYTNYESRKGKELIAHPVASLLFLWTEAERQIRIEGNVQKLPREISEAYFKSRPRESQLGAWTSKQSTVIDSREVLEHEFLAMQERFGDGEIPMPDFWGGFTVMPTSIEFWQGRPSRLHDRILFEKQDGAWKSQRLCP